MNQKPYPAPHITENSPPAAPGCKILSKAISRSFMFLLLGHILLFIAAVTVSVVYLMPAPNQLHNPPALSNSQYYFAAGLIISAVSHLLAITSEIIIMRSGNNKKRMCRALDLYIVSRILHILAWAVILVLPYIVDIALSRISSSNLPLIIIILPDIPLLGIAIRSKRIIRSDGTGLSDQSWVTFLNITIIINYIITAFLTLGFLIMSAQGEAVLLIVDPFFLAGTVMINISAMRLQKKIICQNIPPTPAPGQSEPFEFYKSYEQPEMSVKIYKSYEQPEMSVKTVCQKVSETISLSRSMILAGNFTLSIAAIIIGIIMFTPLAEDILYQSKTIAIGITFIVNGIAHIIIPISAEIMKRSADNKKGMQTALNLYIFARAIHLISWAAVFVIPTFVVILLDIPLILLAFKAKKSIRRDLTFITGRNTAVWVIVGVVLVCLETANIAVLEFLVILRGEYLLGIVLALAIIGIILASIALIKIANAVISLKNQ